PLTYAASGSGLSRCLHRDHPALPALPTRRSSDLEVTGTAEGFVYAVTVNGTTGVRDGFDDSLYDHLEHITELSRAPVCAGFGISTREQAEKVGSACDGVIVGSRIVNLLHEGKADEISGIIPQKSALEKVTSKIFD